MSLLGRLPSGLADPLHIELPFPWALVKVLAVVLLAALILLLLVRWLRRRRLRKAAPARPTPAPGAGPSLAAAIEALRHRYRDPKAVRQACHELSTLLRGHFERATERPFSKLTAGEIRIYVGEGRIARFFQLLTDLQFGRRRPSFDDLDGACDLALEVAREELS